MSAGMSLFVAISAGPMLRRAQHRDSAANASCQPKNSIGQMRDVRFAKQDSSGTTRQGLGSSDDKAAIAEAGIGSAPELTSMSTSQGRCGRVQGEEGSRGLAQASSAPACEFGSGSGRAGAHTLAAR